MGSGRRAKRRRALSRHAEQARGLLALVVLCYLALALWYALAMPPGSGPDESAHARYIAHLAEHRRLPVFDAAGPGPDYEFHQPPLYYALALPSRLFAGRGEVAAERAARIVTVLLAAPLLPLTYVLARRLAPERLWVAPAAAAVVAFLPMRVSLAASVSNDALCEVFAAAALVLILGHVRDGAAFGQGERDSPPGVRAMALAGVMIGLGVLTKSVAVLLLPMAWAGAALAAREAGGYQWRRLASGVAWATGAFAVVAGWWLVRNRILYGDLLGQEAFVTAFRSGPDRRVLPSDWRDGTIAALGLTEYLLLVVGWTLASVVGVFGPVVGNRFIFLPWWVYVPLGLIGLAGLLGFVRYLRGGELADWQRQGWLVCGALGGLLLAGFVAFNLSFFQAQARYMFPALPAAAVAFCLGMQEVAPARAWGVALVVAPALLLVVALLAPPIWILPEFGAP